MKRLRLIQGLSYAMKGFSCVKGALVDVEDDLAEKLLETGRFDQESEPESELELVTNEGAGKEEPSADAIAMMKKGELIALAEERGINIEDCKNNDERIERIQGALGLVSFVQMGLEE